MNEEMQKDLAEIKELLEREPNDAGTIKKENNMTITMKEIQKVLHNQTRANFEKTYHHALGDERAMAELTKAVRAELTRQDTQLAKTQLEIDTLDTDDERRDYIMQVADGGLRQKLIQVYHYLFSNKPATQQNAVYDEVSGLYMDKEQLNIEKRKRIMAIADSEERQKMIVLNAHLF